MSMQPHCPPWEMWTWTWTEPQEQASDTPQARQALEAGRLCMSSCIRWKRPLAKERLGNGEEMDDRLRFTSSQKFLSISPIVLHLLVSFYKKLWCCSHPHQHSLTAWRTAAQAPWGSFISLASTNTERWGWDVGIKGCKHPSFLYTSMS